MITNMLINALGQAIFESCGQALLIYVVLQLFMQLFPGIGSKYRYDINYLGLTVICCWFMANLVNIYIHNAAIQNFSPMLYNSAMAYTAPKQLPTLLQQAEAFITTYAKYITGLYLIGLMLHAFRLMGGFMHIAQIRKPKNLANDGFWSAKADELAKKLRMVKKVSLYFSSRVQIPLTIGHLKPIIIFPLALINNLEAEQVEAILLHELAHIKRYDYLLNIIQCVMETILCFNPFVWLISNTIRQEREYCCDDMVVDEDCNNFTYSKALFIIAQQNTQNYALAMASAGTKKYPLLDRIKRLNTMKTTDSLPKFHLLIIVTIVSIGILLAWGVPQYTMAKTIHHKTKIAAVTASPANAPAPLAPVTAVTAVKVNTTDIDTATGKVVNDTLKPGKKKIKIVIDDNGTQKEYNSLSDLPDSDKSEFFKENHDAAAFNFKFMDSLHFNNMANFQITPEVRTQMLAMRLQAKEMAEKFNSPKWKKQVRDMQKQFNSPEWKKQMEDMQAKMHAQFDNPEWQKNMEDMQAKIRGQFDNPEWKKQMEDVGKQFNNPEWQKQMADMGKKMGEQFNNPEWRKKMAYMNLEMSRQFNSPEWKKQVEKMKIQGELMRKEMNDPKYKKEMEQLNKETEKLQRQVQKEAEDKVNSPEWRKQQDDIDKKIKEGMDKGDNSKKTEQDTTNN
jgi:bla regulator protein BlaR1